MVVTEKAMICAGGPEEDAMLLGEMLSTYSILNSIRLSGICSTSNGACINAHKKEKKTHLQPFPCENTISRVNWY